MKHDADKHYRRSIRLPEYDYGQAGAYFVTIVTRDRASLFGEVVNGKMWLNDGGRLIQAVWDELPDHYPGVECDAFVVMPNHIHGVMVLVDGGGVELNDVGAGLKPARTEPRPTTIPRAGLKPAPTQHGLSEIIRAFKTFSARRINDMRHIPGVSVWQRNYYEHIVRNESDLSRIREYIGNNPMQWGMDRENPNPTEVKSIGKRESWEV